MSDADNRGGRPGARNIAESGRRFVVLSGLSFFTTLGVTWIVVEWLDLAAEFGYLAALIVALLQNFSGMRWYVYPGSTLPVFPQFTAFIISSFGFRALEYLAFLVLHTWLGFYYLGVILGIMFFSAGAKFVFYRLAVFC